MVEIITSRKSHHCHTRYKTIPLIMLVRHGECVHHAKDRLFGQLDVPLDPSGRLQLENCGRLLSEILLKIFNRQGSLKSFISSDLSRCVQSADIIKETIKKEIGVSVNHFTTSRLREYHIGDWENQKTENVYHEIVDYITRFKADPFNAKPPGKYSESINMMRNRVEPLLNYFYDRLYQDSFDHFPNPHALDNFEHWLDFYYEHHLRFEIHLWVVHEGSAKMILDCLNIESWKTNMEDEFLNDIHQNFFTRGDLMILAPHFHMKVKPHTTHQFRDHSEQKYSIAFHYKAKHGYKQQPPQAA